MALLALALTAPLAGGGEARAANYDYDFDLRLQDVNCGYFANTQLCGWWGQNLTGPATLASVGDTYSVHADFDAPLHVPGSDGAALVFTQLIHNGAIAGDGSAGPYEALGELTMNGYVGPNPNFVGPQTSSPNVGYTASAGFVGGNPTDPFSLTGLGATIKILGEGPEPLAGVFVGYALLLGATPENLSNLQGGDQDAPLVLPEGLVGQITGNISGDHPPETFYGFTWQGGLFQSNALIEGADSSASFQFKLFDRLDVLDDDDDDLLANMTLNSDNGFASLMTLSLDPGFYKIGLMTSSPLDPRFTLNFLTPIGVAAAVPEPATWAMMIAGFGLVGGTMRRRATRIVFA